MVTLTRALTTQYDWTVRDISLVQLSNPQGEFRLNDPNVDGEVIVLPGGSRPLSDQELQILTNYLDAGGALVIFAGNSLNAENTSLATSENLNAYLEANFGLRINNDLVIDQTQNFLTPEFPVASSLDSSSYITTRGINRAQAVVVFEVPHSITISQTPPPGVTTTSLIRTTANAYSKTDVTARLLGAQTEADVTAALAQSPDDPTGPLTLAAIAENANTGAKVIVFGSTSPALDTYTQFQTANLNVAFNSLIYATDFNTFFSQIVVQQQQRPQDTPIFATDQVLRNINLITIIGLPFGILALGILVWWSGRERARR
jgi:ABC-2 type transport system permease protein